MPWSGYQPAVFSRSDSATTLIEARTSRSIKRFVRTAHRYRAMQIRADQQTLTAEDPLPPPAHATPSRSSSNPAVRPNLIKVGSASP
jgi:hypothetical protein